MNAKKYLQKVKKLDSMIINKSAELEMWRSVAVGTTGYSDGDRVQSSGSQQKMEDAVVKCIETERLIAEYIRKKSQIIANIEQLSTEEYDLVHRKYVQYLTLDEIARINGKSYSWAKAIHGAALKHLQVILDERENNEN